MSGDVAVLCGLVNASARNGLMASLLALLDFVIEKACWRVRCRTRAWSATRASD